MAETTYIAMALVAAAMTVCFAATARYWHLRCVIAEREREQERARHDATFDKWRKSNEDWERLVTKVLDDYKRLWLHLASEHEKKFRSPEWHERQARPPGADKPN